MSELDLLAAQLAVLEDVRRIAELAAFSVMVAAAFVVGGVIHRFSRGH